jgi:uncharacterized alpha-E superfamily protein
MLSRTASNLYWIGRYMERAEFTARLTEATIRLGSLQGDVESRAAWQSALSVVGANGLESEADSRLTAFNARRFLTLSRENRSSVRSCVEAARAFSRATRSPAMLGRRSTVPGTIFVTDRAQAARRRRSI